MSNDPPDDPDTNDEPKTGFSLVSDDMEDIQLSIPLGDGRSLVVSLGLSIED
ncbi:MAG: hypothetical protein MPN21_20475 [Thermoanaerobaculia bacterium]|nr:hypothetical protein [Thermoanaerobaculia bacterium]